MPDHESWAGAASNDELPTGADDTSTRNNPVAKFEQADGPTTDMDWIAEEMHLAFAELAPQDWRSTPQIRQPVSPPGPDASFDRNQRLGGQLLGMATILVAACCAVPSIMDQVTTRRAGLVSADAWTYIVLLTALIQIAVAIYALGLPDWSTSWVVSLTSTGCAALYATGLALTTFAGQEHQLVQQLGLLDEAFHQRAQLWCFFVTCIMLILAYSYGRFSLRWYQMEKRLIESRH